VVDRELRVGDLVAWTRCGVRGNGTVLRIFRDGTRRHHFHPTNPGELIDFVEVLYTGATASSRTEILTIPLDHMTETTERIG